MRDIASITKEIALHRDSFHGRLTIELLDAYIAKATDSIIVAEEDRDVRRLQGQLKTMRDLKKLLTSVPPA